MHHRGGKFAYCAFSVDLIKEIMHRVVSFTPLVLSRFVFDNLLPIFSKEVETVTMVSPGCSIGSKPKDLKTWSRA